MPVIQNRPSYEKYADTLIPILVRELDGVPQPAGTILPDIVEDYTDSGERFAVTVAWDEFEPLSLADRHAVVMRAYHLSTRHADVNRIVNARGLTKAEYDLEVKLDELTGRPSRRSHLTASYAG